MISLTRQTIIQTLLVFLTLVLVQGFLAIRFLDWTQSQNLARHAIKTSGRVTAKEPDNHNFVRYSFEVNGRPYSGLGNAGGENSEFEELQIGSTVIVYYDATNPEDSFLGNPARHAASATNGVIFVVVVGSLLCMFGLYAKGWLPVTRK